MAHGRMGDYIVDYLAQQNIPLFTPLNVNRLVEEWENDKMGMSGGFLSQSVVTPEIDGAIRPFALFGHYRDEEGLQHAFAIPERLETFVETVNNYIKLQNKPNNEKRVAIYYYKGPGQNAMAAAGMEVAPSLYNLLLHLKKEGYKVDGLPASSKELERMIQAQGAVFGTYAEGAFDNFMKNGRPELITKEQYESWVRKVLRPENMRKSYLPSENFPVSIWLPATDVWELPAYSSGMWCCCRKMPPERETMRLRLFMVRMPHLLTLILHLICGRCSVLRPMR